MANSLNPVLDTIHSCEIKPSLVHGFGLFATCELPAGELLTILDGQLVDWEHYKRSSDVVAGEWNALPGGYLLVRAFKTKYAYINHSRIPNCGLEVELAARLCPVLRLRTLRKILAGEELFLDYRQEELPVEYLQGHGASYL